MNAMEEINNVLKKYSNQLNNKRMITQEEATAFAALLSAITDYRRGLTPNDNNFLSYRTGIQPYHIETDQEGGERK